MKKDKEHSLTKTEKIRKLEKGIHARYGKYTLSRRTTTEQAVVLGNKLIALKKLVKGESGKWTSYVRDKFPEIDIRDIQRFMALGRKMTSDNCPALMGLSQNQLRQLIKTCDGSSLEDYLRSQNIELDFNTDDPDDAKAFQEDINRLLCPSNAGQSLCEKKDKSEKNKSHKDVEKGSKKHGQGPLKIPQPTRLFETWLNKMLDKEDLTQLHENTIERLRRISAQLEKLFERHPFLTEGA